jgi:hypothetical protein
MLDRIMRRYASYAPFALRVVAGVIFVMHEPDFSLPQAEFVSCKDLDKDNSETLVGTPLYRQ